MYIANAAWCHALAAKQIQVSFTLAKVLVDVVLH